jgi:hypothetical protein
MLNDGNKIHNFISSSGSETVINYGSGSNFLTSYGSGSGSTSQKVNVPMVPDPVPQRLWIFPLACTRSRLRACYPPTSRHPTQVLHNTSVVIWNLYCVQNSHQQVSSVQNLRKFKQIINLDIHIFTTLANKSENIDADQNIGAD